MYLDFDFDVYDVRTRILTFRCMEYKGRAERPADYQKSVRKAKQSRSSVCFTPCSSFYPTSTVPIMLMNLDLYL